MEFSEKLKDLRREKGVSQSRLAEDIHISRSAVAKWENGLGLPNESSLELLCAYFGVTTAELLPDQAGEQTLVSKNRIIAEQKKLIIGLVIGAGIGLLLLGYAFIEPLRDYLMMIALGVILVTLGIFNIRGNIASIHWYNRTKVTKENQLSYCCLVGAGTVGMGAAMILSAPLQALGWAEGGTAVILAGLVVGLGLILYAQFKYNRGIF